MLEPEICMEPGFSSTKFSCSHDDIDHIENYNQNEGNVNAIRDHYEVSENFKSEHDHDYEEPYWEPANKEEELMDQLSKLGVPEIMAESIEYVLTNDYCETRFKSTCKLCIIYSDASLLHDICTRENKLDIVTINTSFSRITSFPGPKWFLSHGRLQI